MVKKYTGLMLIIGPLLVIIGYMLQPQNQAFGEDPTDAVFVIGKLAAASSTLLDITTLMLTVGIATFLAGIYLANLRQTNENKEQDPRTSWVMMGIFIAFLGYMSATAPQVAINGALNAGILAAQMLAVNNEMMLAKTIAYKENLKTVPLFLFFLYICKFHLQYY